MENKFYTAQEVANRLKLKKTTVYDMIKRGELQASKIGKQFRISQQQLDAYLGEVNDTASAGQTEHTPRLIADIPTHTADSAIRQMDYLLHTNGLIISSQESTIVELIRSQAEGQPGNLPILHSYMNDYNSLYSLYYEKTHLALISDCDQTNHPLWECLLPGIPVTAIELCNYQIGFYVAKGNPKNIQTIQDLYRPDVTISNRERGNICRMFLDTQLAEQNISSAFVQGYKNEVLSHMALVNAILSGKADAGIGDMAQLAAYPQLDFVPLTTVSMYLVFHKSYETHPAFKAITDTIASENFQALLKHFQGYHLPEEMK